MNPAAYILPSSDIDRDKWDNCIASSGNGLVYSASAYLDAMADQWHGIVIADYRALMPLPWRIRFGFRYAYMPAFMQQTGLTGDYTPGDLKAILRTLPDFVSLADIHFNFANTELTGYGSITEKTNLVLDLSQGYDSIYGSYRKDLRENLRKAGDFNYGGIALDAAIRLFISLYAGTIQSNNADDYRRFLGLCAEWEPEGKCFARCVTGNNGEILAAAVLLKDSRRIYNIMNAVTRNGREQNANELLLDRLIREFSGQALVFDFEGSGIPGVKAFYEKFSPSLQPYYQYHYNGLPWWLRLFRR